MEDKGLPGRDVMIGYIEILEELGHTFPREWAATTGSCDGNPGAVRCRPVTRVASHSFPLRGLTWTCIPSARF